MNLNWLDKAIMPFSPSWALNRSLSREKLQTRSDKYAAAKSSRMTGNWNPQYHNINDILKSSRRTVSNRVRQLVRDFPYLDRAVKKGVEYTVGYGLEFHSKILKAGTKELDHNLIQQTDDAFLRWADEADVSGKLHYYEIMQLAKRQDFELGEFVIVKEFLNDSSRFLPLALRLIEPDWLTEENITLSDNSNMIEQGVEYSPVTGQVIAYHFTDPDSWGKAVRVPADRVIHKFQTLRPGQLRGISPFVSGVLMSHTFHELIDTELNLANMASKWLAFVTTSDPTGMQAAFENELNPGGEPRKIDTMDNAIVEYLQNGEEVKVHSNPRPGSNFAPFIKLLTQIFAITTGIPYDLISGDYSDTNFSTLQVERNDFKHQQKPEIKRHIMHFCQPTAKWFFNDAYLTGALPYRFYGLNPTRYQRAIWQPQGVEPIDALKDAKATQIKLNEGLDSPSRYVAERHGLDLEDIYQDQEKAKEKATKSGLFFPYQHQGLETSTSSNNNPAALEGQNAEPIKLISKK